MSKRSDRMYSKNGEGSPTMKRDEESGEMSVGRHKKKEADAGADGAIREGGGEEAMPMHVSHAMARADMNKRHEAEHMVHDHHKAGSKKELHERHEKEMKALHSQHEKEMEMGEEKKEPEKKETGEKKIEKVESGKKE